MNIKDIAEKLKQKLEKYEEFKGLYFYGSRLTDSYRDDSDVDIAAIFTNEPNYDEELSISGDIIDIEIEFDLLIDFRLLTNEELDLNPIYFNEIKKGIFYGA